MRRGSFAVALFAFGLNSRLILAISTPCDTAQFSAEAKSLQRWQVVLKVRSALGKRRGLR